MRPYSKSQVHGEIGIAIGAGAPPVRRPIIEDVFDIRHQAQGAGPDRIGVPMAQDQRPEQAQSWCGRRNVRIYEMLVEERCNPMLLPQFR